eukprot:TRINITY_DN6706_c0_g3_i1.p1 TRINITY_DN6706_c0_g3~~TRINITY_DN6706_c0_g3_i1.p1  ORF type:complete len:136 (+),score=31.88 TRINITY_DN6706_c0_g3_i1:87-494(+)
MTYEELEIPSPEGFDYAGCEEPWCRYCGARYSSGWNRGPWGKRTLCIPHYVHWFQKKKLSLTKWKELPTTPIDPSQNTELKYLTFKKRKQEEILERAKQHGAGGDGIAGTVLAAPDPYARSFAPRSRSRTRSGNV